EPILPPKPDEITPAPMNAKSESIPSFADKHERVVGRESPPQKKRHDGEPLELASDVMLGTTKPSLQFGLIGEADGRTIALDLNETHTISLFGVQGGGKSYTLGSIVEMSCVPIPRVN